MGKPQILRVVAAIGLVSLFGCTMTGRFGKPPAFTKDKEKEDPVQDRATYFYSAGRGVQDFAAPPHAVVAAVAEAMDDLKFTVTKRGREGTVSQIDGRTADDRAVRRQTATRWEWPLSLTARGDRQSPFRHLIRDCAQVRLAGLTWG
jgi:hypothetical protein